MIHPTAIVHPHVAVGDDVEIGPFCIVGSDHGELAIPDGSIIRSHSIVEGGSSFLSRLETGHHVLIRHGNVVGHNLRIGSYSSLEGGAVVGDYVRLHGRCEATQVLLQDFARVFGGCYLTDNKLPPSDQKAPPVIGAAAVICMGSIVVAGTTVGVGAYVGGNSTVTKDIPAGGVWVGTRLTDRHVSQLGWRHYRHPWTGHYAHTYPEEAQARIDRLHERIMRTGPKVEHAES